MADEPVAVANTLASPLGPDRVGQVGENFRASDILLFEVEHFGKVFLFHTRSGARGWRESYLVSVKLQARLWSGAATGR